MFTRSSKSRRETPASAPGLLPRRSESSVRIIWTESVQQKSPEGPFPDRWWRTGREKAPRGRGAAWLGEHLDDDAAVLGAARLRLVRRDRLVLAVADHVHLVQRNLVLLVEIPLHRLGAGQADLLVHGLVAD